MKYIQSPNYPSNYDSNSDCEWRITSIDRITIKMEDARFESSCSCDRVRVYDGRTEYHRELVVFDGGEINKEYTSSGYEVLIKFHSDSSINQRGFRLQYYLAIAGSDDVNIGKIVGIVVGIVVSLILCKVCW